MYTNQLRLSCQSNLDYLELMWDVTSRMLATEAGRKALVDSSAINVIIDLAFAIADNPALVNIQMNQPHEQVDPPSERQRALMLLTEIWKLKPEVIQNELNQTRVAEAILTVLKKGCRDSSRVISFVSIHLMADLLLDFSSQRNKYAPRIYKALTFIMIENYLDQEFRIEMNNLFIQIYKQI